MRSGPTGRVHEFWIEGGGGDVSPVVVTYRKIRISRKRVSTYRTVLTNGCSDVRHTSLRTLFRHNPFVVFHVLQDFKYSDPFVTKSLFDEKSQEGLTFRELRFLVDDGETRPTITGMNWKMDDKLNPEVDLVLSCRGARTVGVLVQTECVERRKGVLMWALRCTVSLSVLQSTLLNEMVSQLGFRQ